MKLTVFPLEYTIDVVADALPHAHISRIVRFYATVVLVVPIKMISISKNRVSIPEKRK